LWINVAKILPAVVSQLQQIFSFIGKLSTHFYFIAKGKNAKVETRPEAFQYWHGNNDRYIDQVVILQRKLCFVAWVRFLFGNSDVHKMGCFSFTFKALAG
jgi:hypothetical protein